MTPPKSRCTASSCTGLVVIIDRTTVTRSMRQARPGRYWLKRTPGRSVAIVSNSPRTSRGASGLGSNVSRWLGPPGQNARITPRIADTDFASAAARSRNRSERESPNHDKAPAQIRPA